MAHVGDYAWLAWHTVSSVSYRWSLALLKQKTIFQNI